MPVTAWGSTLQSIVPDSVSQPGGGDDSTANGDRSWSRERWQQLIDHPLIEWGRHPDELEDEGVSPPSAATVQTSIRLARLLCDAEFRPPDRIVPDPNGGIVFELAGTSEREVLHVWEDGEIEYQRFDGSKLIERWPLEEASPLVYLYVRNQRG